MIFFTLPCDLSKPLAHNIAHLINTTAVCFSRHFYLKSKFKKHCGYYKFLKLKLFGTVPCQFQKRYEVEWSCGQGLFQTLF